MDYQKLSCLIAGLLLSGAAGAADLSFLGTFSRDDEVQLFSFSVGTTSSVTLRSLGYAGGVNAAGQTITRGGFDTSLSLFDGNGVLIDSNDDGLAGEVATDSGSGQHWDAFLQTVLAPGNYRASLVQFDNFALGPNLADGFFHAGEGNFTAGFGCGGFAFCDVSGVSPFNQRDGHWAFDILIAGSETVPAVPEPATCALLLAGLGLLGFKARSSRSGQPA